MRIFGAAVFIATFALTFAAIILVDDLMDRRAGSEAPPADDLQVRNADEADPGPGIPTGRDAIIESGELIVLTTPNPAVFKQKDGVTDGFEVDLARRFARSLGLDVTFVSFDDVDGVIEAIERGEGHIAAAGMTVRERIGATAVTGPAYKNVQAKVVCRKGDTLPESLKDMNGQSLAVMSETVYADFLTDFENTYAEIDVDVRRASSAVPLLTAVAEGQIDCAVAESHILAIARHRHLNLVTAFDLVEEDQQLAWLVAEHSMDLMPDLELWFSEAHESGLLAQLDERYFNHYEDFDYVDLSYFRNRVDSRLPKYEDLFRDAAGQHELDWTMLAAQGYQESHWDPKARSPTGVRGLMMLTLPTAKEVGVTNRLDPEQSIRGGAKYMDRMFELLPETVTGYDRLWMAMAAYNVGYGHLMDARRLARRVGRDPDDWHAIEDMLPLLTKKKYYSTVPHGYARGYEPVHYVNRIRDYDEVLTNVVDNPEQPPFMVQRPEPVEEQESRLAFQFASDVASGPLGP